MSFQYGSFARKKNTNMEKIEGKIVKRENEEKNINERLEFKIQRPKNAFVNVDCRYVALFLFPYQFCAR